MTLPEKLIFLRKWLRECLLAWMSPSSFEQERERERLSQEIQARWPRHNLCVHELIRESGDESDPGHDGPTADKRFIVFVDATLDLDWVADFPLSKTTEKGIAVAEAINARRCKHLPREQVLEFRRLSGQAIVQALRDNDRLSRQLANEAGQFLKDRTVERSRIWTLGFALLLLVLFVAMTATTAELLYPFGQPWLHSPSAMLTAIHGGVVGAFLSLVQSAARAERDAAAGRWLHFLEAFTKFTAGSLLGLIALVLTLSEQTIPTLRDVGNDTPSLFLLAVAAGLFERLIPKIISTYGQNTTSVNPSDETKSNPD